MKTPTLRRPRRGFTLIELLVVIAIIAVLAAAGFAAGSAAISRARATAARSVATSLEQAVNAFYSEYGSLPDVSSPVDTDQGQGVQLLQILMGQEGTGGNIQNTRGIRFLNAPEGKGNRNGMIYQGNTIRGLYDPWGNGYTVILDTDYEERLTFSLGGRQVTLNGRRVAVYSRGQDQQAGTNDDVMTW